MKHRERVTSIRLKTNMLRQLDNAQSHPLNMADKTDKLRSS